MTRQHRRLLISSSDLNEARTYLSLLIGIATEDPKDSLNALPEWIRGQVRSALYIAFVVSYARPFSSNRGSDATPCLPNRVLSQLSETQKGLHHRLVESRNRTEAHSDSDLYSIVCDLSQRPTVRVVYPPQALTPEVPPALAARRLRAGEHPGQGFTGQVLTKMNSTVDSVTYHSPHTHEWFGEAECWTAYSIIECLMLDISERLSALERRGIPPAA